MNQKAIMLSAVLLLGASSFADNGKVALKWRYQEAESGQVQRAQTQVNIPHFNSFSTDRVSTDSRMEKTLFVLELGQSLKKSLEAFNAACEVKDLPKPIPFPGLPRPILPKPIVPKPIRPILPLPRPIRPIPEPPVLKDCANKRMKIADALLETLKGFDARMDQNADLSNDESIQEVLDLGEKLAQNMKDHKDRPVFPVRPFEVSGGPKIRGSVPMAATVAGGLNITAGGAQDFEFVKELIKKGTVPHHDNLVLEGFLSEFDLSLSDRVCNDLMCVHPGVAVDPKAKKLFVQIAMNSNVTKANFKRKPLNLGVVVDISGSMGSKDRQEKYTRLEWAKRILSNLVDNELTEQDILSITVFDTKPEVVLPATRVTDRSAIKDVINKLAPRGGTDVYTGLDKAFDEVISIKEDFKGYEERVLLISDAGHNPGNATEKEFLALIEESADLGVGITAIGLGANFKQELVQVFTQSKGGNYVFAQSGTAMKKFFDSFDFLVTPVAFNFRVDFELSGLNAKLNQAYGVPAQKGAPVRELIHIRSLFFSEAGGAIVLEFDLK